jgi:hypothetical protein
MGSEGGNHNPVENTVPRFSWRLGIFTENLNQDSYNPDEIQTGYLPDIILMHYYCTTLLN